MDHVNTSERHTGKFLLHFTTGQKHLDGLRASGLELSLLSNEKTQ